MVAFLARPQESIDPPKPKNEQPATQKPKPQREEPLTTPELLIEMQVGSRRNQMDEVVNWCTNKNYTAPG